jgi:hypothetical protein
MVKTAGSLASRNSICINGLRRARASNAYPVRLRNSGHTHFSSGTALMRIVPCGISTRNQLTTEEQLGVPMDIFESVLISTIRGDEESRPEIGVALPAQTHFPTVPARNDCELLRRERRKRISHAREHAKRQARDSPVPLCCVPGEDERLLHKFTQDAPEPPRRGGRFGNRTPPLCLSEVQIQDHKRKTRRALDGIRIERTPKFAMLSDGGPFTTGISSSIAQELQASLVQLMYQLKRVSALPQRSRGLSKDVLFLFWHGRYCQWRRLIMLQGVSGIFSAKPPIVCKPLVMKQQSAANNSGAFVEIYVTDDTIGRYFRRYQLAFRMVSHGARTQTVCEWSGLTRDQLVTLRRRWGFDPDERRRGPAPTAFNVFFKSERHSTEAALFASICQIVGVTVRSGEETAQRLASLESGELLCEAFEAYKEWEPDARFEFEHAVLLAGGVEQGKEVALGHCSECHGAVLIDRMGANQTRCGLCNRPARQTPQDGMIEDDADGVPSMSGERMLGA